MRNDVDDETTCSFLFFSQPSAHLRPEHTELRDRTKMIKQAYDWFRYSECSTFGSYHWYWANFCTSEQR